MQTTRCDDSCELEAWVATVGNCPAAEVGTVAYQLDFRWDSSTITATHSEKPADVSTVGHFGHDAIYPFIERLIQERVPFVTQHGEGAARRKLEWTITE